MIRLRDNFKAGQPLAAMEADQCNTIARWLNSVTVMGGPRVATPYSLTLYPPVDFAATASTVDFAWRSIKAAATTIGITAGDIELGPDTVIEWGDITNSAVTVEVADDTWWVWVNVNLEDLTAEMYNGATITALTESEKLNTVQKRICKAVSVDSVIIEVKVYQCGNIFIPRAAG